MPKLMAISYEGRLAFYRYWDHKEAKMKHYHLLPVPINPYPEESLERQLWRDGWNLGVNETNGNAEHLRRMTPMKK